MFGWAGRPQALGKAIGAEGQRKDVWVYVTEKKAREEMQSKIKVNIENERRNFVAVLEEEI